MGYSPSGHKESDITERVHSDFGAQENKICHCFDFFPHEVMGLDAMILVF